MALFKDFSTVANDVNFQNRVLYALQVAALAVMAEANSTSGHVQRISYATKILQGNSNVANVAMGVLTNLTVAGETDTTKTTGGDYGIPDGDIQFVVNSLFSAYAGAAN
jgi:hypothetical protein